jgi:ATP-dependent exoDNAse (exonuclease V) alpha subunit
MDRFYPEEDMILCPNNKSFGTLELNINIADKLGKKRGAEVHEVIVGWNKKYFAVGDKVLVQKQEAMITEIVRNGLYRGKEPNPSSVKLNRWGLYEVDNKEDKEDVASKHLSLEEMEAMLLAANANASEVDDKVNQASHIIKFKMLDSEIEGELSTTGELMDLIFAYALTIHKAQGSEWKRVILFLHSSHANMTSRELLYTAITRAKESLYIICEPNTFVKGILYQKIKGNTLAEKAEYFKGKKEKLKENQDPE